MSKWILLLLLLGATLYVIYRYYPQVLEKFKAMPQMNEMKTDTTSKKDLVTMLNKALADEWLAYYQYWIGAKVVKGPLAEKIVSELMEHAKEEYDHAGMLAKRIIELGGTPLLHPKDWFVQATCGFLTPNNPESKVILDQNIQGEVCAVNAYKEIIAITPQEDTVTHEMLAKILADEEKHIKDLNELVDEVKK